MKILMTAGTGGGVWTYAIQLADELSRHGVQIVLAVMGESLRQQQRKEAHAIAGLQLIESNCQPEYLDECSEDAKEAGEWLAYLEGLNQPDLVHLNHLVHSPIPFKAPTLVVAHSCRPAWTRAVRRTDTPANWHTSQAALSSRWSRAHAVVAPTRAMYDDLVSVFGPLPRAMVIPHGRRSFAALSPKWPFILCTARPTDEANNVSLMKAAAPQLTWPIWVAGEVPLVRSHLHRTRGNFHMLGHLPFADLTRWLRRAAIYCLPTRYEPFGMGVLEAGLCGCALVLGDIPSLRELWGNAALYVPPDDRDALAATLQNLIALPELREKYGTLARERALKYSPERMAASYLALYHELIQANGDEFSLRPAACAS